MERVIQLGGTDVRGAGPQKIPGRGCATASKQTDELGCLRVPPATHNQGQDIVLIAVVAVAFDRNLCSGRTGWGCCCTTLAVWVSYGFPHLSLTGSIPSAHNLGNVWPQTSTIDHPILHWPAGPFLSNPLADSSKIISCQPHALMGLAAVLVDFGRIRVTPPRSILYSDCGNNWQKRASALPD